MLNGWLFTDCGILHTIFHSRVIFAMLLVSDATFTNDLHHDTVTVFATFGLALIRGKSMSTYINLLLICFPIFLLFLNPYPTSINGESFLILYQLTIFSYTRSN